MQRALRLVWDAAAGWIVSWIVMLILQGALPALTIYISKLLIDGLVVAIDSGGEWSTVRPIIWLGVLMGGLILVGGVLSSVLRWVRTALSETVRDNLRGRLHEKAVTLDLAFYESSNYHDRLYRVMGDVAQRPVVMLESFGTMVQNVVTVLGMAALILGYAWWLPILLLGGAAPALAVAARFSRLHHQWWKKRTQDERWAQYYETILTHSAIAAEVRLFDLGSHFRSLYQELRATLRKERIALERRRVGEYVAAGLVALVVTAGAMIWISLRALRGLATLGDIALFYQAFNRGQTLMRSVLVSVGQMYDSSLFVSELFDFLSLEPLVREGDGGAIPRRPEVIRVEDVTFTYPGANSPTLKGLNLEIRRGETVAIVGENGAGKSTLLKLLCRFYDPERGRIAWDGVPLSTLSLRHVRRMITVLFQFPVQYHATAKENITYGDVRVRNSNESAIEEAAMLADIDEKIRGLPAGYETLLGKWFVDGQELSGGEWQRLAMARAFYRDAPVIILDEPTSMLDSWAEGAWFDRFRRLAEDRVAIVITHRFTIARRADRIFVMKDGQIVESGSHSDLVAAGGTYAESWTDQVSAAG